MAKQLTQEFLKSVLRYNPRTGIFHRKARDGYNSRNARFAGKRAGWISSHGYLKINIDYTEMYAHQIAWIIMTGALPKQEIDYIDRKRSNNKWRNLREATHTQNSRNQARRKNNTSGAAGVYWSKRWKKWIAQLAHGNETMYLGGFDTFRAAKTARQTAVKILHNEFAPKAAGDAPDV